MATSAARPWSSRSALDPGPAGADAGSPRWVGAARRPSVVRVRQEGLFLGGADGPRLLRSPPAGRASWRAAGGGEGQHGRGGGAGGLGWTTAGGVAGSQRCWVCGASCVSSRTRAACGWELSPVPRGPGAPVHRPCKDVPRHVASAAAVAAEAGAGGMLLVSRLAGRHEKSSRTGITSLAMVPRTEDVGSGPASSGRGRDDMVLGGRRVREPPRPFIRRAGGWGSKR